MYTRLSSARGRRSGAGFTLLELIVVIVILGVLALLAIPTFSSVLSKSHYATLTATGQALGRDAAALAAFDREAPADDVNAQTTAISELPSAEVTASNPADGQVTLTQGAYSVCVTFGTTLDSEGSVTTGPCTNTSVYQQAVLNYGPEVYWPLSDASGPTAKDISGNNITGNYTSSGVTYGVAPPSTVIGGTAVAFNGTSGEVCSTLPTAVAGNYSIVGWENMSSLPTVNNGDPAPFGTLGYYGFSGIGVRSDDHLTVVYDTYSWQETSALLPTTGWHQFALTMTSGGGGTIYIDGVQVATTSSSIGAGTIICVGGHQSGRYVLGSESNRYFPGSESNVAFFNSVLSANQIATLYNIGK